MYIRDFIRELRARRARGGRMRRVRRIDSILRLDRGPDTRRAEEHFDELQAKYPMRPEYGYDLASVLARAAQRAAGIMKQMASGDRRLRVLELGAGDGMLGALLRAAGHEATLVDIADWRMSAAKTVHFLEADCSECIPVGNDEFDLVCSFNSFEHFLNPTKVFAEACRVTRPGGLMHFEFGPLYRSPWGLHAYRSLLMPYPQFLFSDDFLAKKLKENGIWDLGEEQRELQSLNRWTGMQFTRLWELGDCETVSLNGYVDEGHVDIIQAYPESFAGRGLSFDDVTLSAINVWLRRRPILADGA